MSLVLLFILFFGHICNANLINRINNDCEPPPLPTFLPDSGMGSYCRFSPAYSTLDFVFLIDASSRNDERILEVVQNVLYNSLMLHDGRFSNASFTNDAAFIYVANVSKLDVGFGELNDYEEVAKHFKKIIFWKNELQSTTLDLSGGLQYIHEKIFNYSNGRGKFLTVIANTVNQRNSTNIDYAEKMKEYGVQIFTIGFTGEEENLHIDGTFFDRISTIGWQYLLFVNSSNMATSSDLSTAFQNFARQCNCRCPPNTSQFSGILSSGGSQIKEIYSDCLFNSNGEITNDTGTLDEAVQLCRSDIDYNSRPVALNTSLKYQFMQGFLHENDNLFWTGKDNASWITYSGTTLPVKYLPSSINDSIIQHYCKSTLNITAGESAALVPFNGTYVLCRADPSAMLLPLCESKALDAFDNIKLCPSPFINADTRPQQIGSSCSMTLYNMYLEIVVIVDVSKFATKEQLTDASQILIDAFGKLNFDTSSLHSSRLSLIVFSSFAVVKAQFGEIYDVKTLSQKFNLTKYHNKYDKNQNALMAFQLAQTMLIINKSHRRQGIIFISAGINNAFDPYVISESLKSSFNVRIITIATHLSDKIDRISSPGMNYKLNSELQNSISKGLGYINCYCQKGFTQFVAADKSTNETIYYADCLRGYSSLQTPSYAFQTCKKLGGVPISLTSETKNQFVLNSKIFDQIEKSPVFVTGLKRHAQNINSHQWVHFANANFSLGSYPPKLFDFDDLKTNCSMAVTIQQKTFIAPVECDDTKLPYICQIAAMDGDRFVKDIN